MRTLVFEVVPSRRAWEITDGETHVLASFDTRDEAIEQARLFAETLKPAELVVRGGHGRVEMFETYAHEMQHPMVS
jgi:hypothetical protein